MLNLFLHPTPCNYFYQYFTTINYNLSSLSTTFSLIVATAIIFNIFFSTKIFTPYYFTLIFFFPSYHITTKTPGINLGLINGLSFWHPVLLLVIVVLILKYIYNLVFGAYTFTIITYVFIGLGCWWAGQELLWMGWWNWDGVENSLLLLFVVAFSLSHLTKSFYKTLPYKYYVVCFFILYFFIFNKTNLYKSIHSFTNSTANNYSWVILMYLILFFLLLQYKLQLKLPFIYNLTIWCLYCFYFLLTTGNIFSKLSFFFLINCSVWYTILIFTNPIFSYIFFFCPDLLYFSLFVTVSTFVFTDALRVQFHKIVLLLLVMLALKLGFKNYIFWTFNADYSSVLHNVTQTNRLIKASDIKISGILEALHNLKLVFKNSLRLSCYNYMETSTTPLLPLKQITLSITYRTQLYFFLVTLMVYSKQKLKYNYYI